MFMCLKIDIKINLTFVKNNFEFSVLLVYTPP